MPLAAHDSSRPRLAPAGVHTNARSASPAGRSSIDRARGDAEHLLPLEVGREHATRVSTGEQVVRGDEAELAGVGGGAGDHDATRLEQGGELLGGERRARRRGCSRRIADLDQRVDGDDAAIAPDDQRVDVDADHVGAFDRQAAEPDQRGDDRSSVERRRPAELTEQPLRAQRVQHLLGVERRERRRPEHDVGDRLGEHAADAEHHRRAELWITHDPRDQLARAAQHRGDQQGDRAVRGSDGRQQLGGRAGDGPGIGETQPDQAALGLVGDALAVDLDDDRVADLGRSGDRGGRVGDDPFVEERYCRTSPAAPSTRTRTRWAPSSR